MPRAKTRVYVVKNKDDPSVERLVDATYDHMAIRHVSASQWSATTATKDDLIRLLTRGVRVEQAVDDEQP